MRRRQIKVFGSLFSKSKWGAGQRPAYLAFGRFFEGPGKLSPRKESFPFLIQKIKISVIDDTLVL